jgi:hypothetical protein
MPRIPKKSNKRKVKCPKCEKIWHYIYTEKRYWKPAIIIQHCNECQSNINFYKMLEDMFLSD